MAEVPPAGTPAWYHREAALPGGLWRVRCIVDDRHGDGEVVDDPSGSEESFVLWRAGLDDEGRPYVRVDPEAVPGTPPLWFVQIPERDVDPWALTLVAFATDHLPPGTVVTDPVFFHLPVRSDEQVGALRWWPDEAVVDQVYVAPDHRRLHAATAIIYAASAFHQLNGWPGRLHSDGRRTTMGDQLVAGLRHPDRIAPLAKRMDPMDPTA